MQILAIEQKVKYKARDIYNIFQSWQNQLHGIGRSLNEFGQIVDQNEFLHHLMPFNCLRNFIGKNVGWYSKV
jgi:hypothetical protein